MTLDEFAPLGDFLLVREPGQEESAGGIVMPGNSETFEAIVVKCGPGRHSDFDGKQLPMPPVKVGKRVTYNPRYEPATLYLGGEKYLLIMARDLTGLEL